MAVCGCAAVCVPLQAWRAAPPSEQRHPRPGPPPLGPDPVSGGGGLHPLLQPVEGRQVFREGVEQHNPPQSGNTAASYHGAGWRVWPLVAAGGGCGH